MLSPVAGSVPCPSAFAVVAARGAPAMASDTVSFGAKPVPETVTTPPRLVVVGDTASVAVTTGPADGETLAVPVEAASVVVGGAVPVGVAAVALAVTVAVRVALGEDVGVEVATAVALAVGVDEVGVVVVSAGSAALAAPGVIKTGAARAPVSARASRAPRLRMVAIGLYVLSSRAVVCSGGRK